MNIKIEFFNIKIQNCNIITHDVNSKMSMKKYKILFLILAVITLHIILQNFYFLYYKYIYLHIYLYNPRANGAKRRSGRKLGARVTNPRANGAKRRSGCKPGARVTNFVLAEFKVVARDR